MKTLNAIVKIVTALAAVAGAVYIVATYGEQIVAWAKKILSSLPKCPCCEKAEPAEEAPAAEEPAPAEEAPAAEEPAPVEEAPAEEPAPEVIVAENEPVADDKDFAE
ncbi:MAG: hypothetical protein ACI4PH_09185 [Faecousia sp.]